MRISSFRKTILISLIITLFLPLSLKAQETDFEFLDLSSLTEQKLEIMPEKYLGWSGLWQQFKENISLALTFNDLKKAEKKLLYAENRLRAGGKLLQTSNEANKEKAIKIISQADSYKYRLSSYNPEDLDKLWQENTEEEIAVFLKDLSAHQINKSLLWSQAESVLPLSGLDKLNSLRSETETKDLIFLSELQNNLKDKQDLAIELEKASQVVKNFKNLREEFVANNQPLLKKLQKYQDEEVTSFLEEKLANLQTEKKATFTTIINSEPQVLRKNETEKEIKSKLQNIKESTPLNQENNQAVKASAQTENYLEDFKSSPEYQKFLQNIDSSWRYREANESQGELAE
ncbi:MAG: hypothetical protein K9M44_02835 [Candidatus Pacebacteria bacterium]|nr:hypothetical protein [Candidatus Paceibacterota bacterium]